MTQKNRTVEELEAALVECQAARTELYAAVVREAERANAAEQELADLRAKVSVLRDWAKASQG